MKNPRLLVAFALALGFAACSDDDSSSYILITDLELPEAQASTSSDDSDTATSSDSGDLASAESAPVDSSDFNDGSSSSSEGSNAASSSSEASSSESDLSESSSSTEEGSSGSDTLAITIPVLTIDSSQVIPAGETVYATIDESASETCILLCSTDSAGVTLTIDGKDHTMISTNTGFQLDSPCAGETYVMSATADIYCFTS